MTSNKNHWSYLAAMFDAEGCINIARSRRSKTAGETFYMNYVLQLDVYNSDIKLMKWLLQYFGGVYYSRNRNTQVTNWDKAHNWRPKGANNKKQILLGILPYLVIKREQAINALKYLDMQGTENPVEREKLYQNMRTLNQTGITVETDTLNTQTPSE